MTKKQEVEEVFDYWVAHCRPKGRRPILDGKRSRKIEAGLKYFSIADMCLAVDGNVSSAFHQGENPRKTVYDEIDLIFRDVAYIEKFIGIAETQPTSTAAERFLQSLENDER
jgi:hypothetical protein